MKKIILFCLSLLVLISAVGCIKLPIDQTSSTTSDFTVKNFISRIIDTENAEYSKVEPAQITMEQEKELYCYSALDQNQRKIYKIILTAVNDMTSGWINLGRCGKDYNYNIAVAYQAVSEDHPQIFWLPLTYLFNTAVKGQNSKVLIAFDYSYKKDTNSYTVTKSERATMQNELNQKVSEIVKAAKQYKTSFERQLFLHDYLCNNITYTTEEKMGSTVYGALINGKAACEGYSRAMQLLCNKVGIPCILISGESEGTGHMWNLINPGDGWYHLDVTWDDNTELGYWYFNLTDTAISTDHEIAPLFTTLSGKENINSEIYNFITYPCELTRNNYFHQQGLIFDTNFAYKVANDLIGYSQNGAKEVQFLCENAALYEDVTKNYDKYMHKIQINIDRTVGRNKIIITQVMFINNVIAIQLK